MEDIIKKIYDRKLISDLRFSEDVNDIIIWSKRSKYRVHIPKSVNETISYLSGVIVGYGNISIVSRKNILYPRTKLRIFNKSRKYLEQINSEFSNIFNLHEKILKKEDKDCHILTINNKIMILYFLKIIGLYPGKKLGLEIPKILRSRALLKYFIAGLFDTDGFRTDTFGIMMHGSNYKFLKDIAHLMKKYYDIEPRKIYYGTLKTPSGIRTRSQFQIGVGSMEKFISVIPLRHSRWTL